MNVTFLDGMEISYQCAYCGEGNEVFVDASGGLIQEYIEDCQVCCRPNILYVALHENGEPTVEARREDE